MLAILSPLYLLVKHSELEAPLAVIDDPSGSVAAVVTEDALAGHALLAPGHGGHLAHRARGTRPHAARTRGAAGAFPLAAAVHVHRTQCVYGADLVLIAAATHAAAVAAGQATTASAAAAPVGEDVVHVVKVCGLSFALHEQPRPLDELVHGHLLYGKRGYHSGNQLSECDGSGLTRHSDFNALLPAHRDLLSRETAPRTGKAQLFSTFLLLLPTFSALLQQLNRTLSILHYRLTAWALFHY